MGAALLAGCGGDTKPAAKKPAPALAKRKPAFVRAWEKAVKQEESLYVRSAGYTPEVHVKCYDTKVVQGSRLQGGCDTDAYGTKTGDILDAEQLPARVYGIVYEKGRPSNFKVEPPMDDPLHTGQ